MSMDKKYIREVIEAYLDTHLEEKVKKIVDARTRKLEKKIEESNQQLVAIKDQGSQLVTSSDIKKEIKSALEIQVFPQVQRLVELAEYQLQDGDSLVTEYRKRVHAITDPELYKNKGKTLSLTYSGAPAKETRAAFQKRMFVFNDAD
jgi:hypothetical protein